jgi:hypothetical protein
LNHLFSLVIYVKIVWLILLPHYPLVLFLLLEHNAVDCIICKPLNCSLTFTLITLLVSMPMMMMVLYKGTKWIK